MHLPEATVLLDQEGEVNTCPVNTKHLYNICTMLDQRRRRWATLAHCWFEVWRSLRRWSNVQSYTCYIGPDYRPCEKSRPQSLKPVLASTQNAGAHFSPADETLAQPYTSTGEMSRLC